MSTRSASSAPRLSSPLSGLGVSYDVVVVGSGYGGGVAASRLARAGREVCVLERGREFFPGDFPANELDAIRESQVHTPAGAAGSALGLFDFTVEGEYSVLRGCGLGGTSLINAGVALEVEPEVFADPCWPPEIREDLQGVRRGYARARAVLNPQAYPQSWPRLAKQDALRASAAAMGEPWKRIPINVSFNETVNPFGVQRARCTLCGDCVTGCNDGAKNTVAATYLPDAWRHGAQIFTEVSVQRVARRGQRWAVFYEPVGVGRERFGGEPLVVCADVVILAAGTLGSTKILLRSREAGLETSQRLGERFSGNADVIAFGYNNDVPINGVGAGSRAPDRDRPVGPTITSMIDGRHPSRPLSERFLIQEGALPGAIDAIYPASFRAAARQWGIDTDDGIRDRLAEERRELRSRLPDGARKGALANTQTFLGMGHDSASGRLRLDAQDQLRIDWPGAPKEPSVKRLNERILDATAALGGTYVPNPAWGNGLRSNLISVHPLGGCGMGADAARGVTDHRGRVFAGSEGSAVHEGLLVMDGSVMPRSLGTNPLLTISAIAERSVALLAESRSWHIDYDLYKAPRRRLRSRSDALGIRFTERMAGTLALRDAPQEPAAASFVLTLLTEDLAATLAEPTHRLSLFGTVSIPALSPEPLQVASGQFQLLTVDPDHHETRNMIYELALVAADGRRWSFRGTKHIHDDDGPDLWSDTTTLSAVLRDDSGQLAGEGTLRISPADFSRQVRTIQALNARSVANGLRVRARFGRFFLGRLFDTYGDIFARPTVFEPTAPPRERRTLRLDAPELHHVRTMDGVSLLLTRYRGGGKGPVLLCHGLGVSSRIFTVDTTQTSLVEHLFSHGYDVWLLDYRSSIDLPSAQQQAEADTIARYDLPEAVAAVRRLAGADSVQVVAHCFGATVFYMSMLSGALSGVRSAVTSQATPHLVGARDVRLKARLRLPGLLGAAGIPGLSAYTDADAGVVERLADRGLSLYPTDHDERCSSATCRRITFMYARLFEHDQLTVETHRTLHELFGVANTTAFRHLARMVRAGRLVDAQGSDTYMRHPERLALPLRMIHGAENACFDPSGSAQSLEWLRAHNGGGLYSRVVIPAHGHIDCIFGKDAASTVYPHIVSHLEATA